MKQEEHKLQCVLVKYLDYMNYDFFAIPNGGLRNIKVASKLKAEGLNPEWPIYSFVYRHPFIMGYLSR